MAIAQNVGADPVGVSIAWTTDQPSNVGVRIETLLERLNTVTVEEGTT